MPNTVLHIDSSPRFNDSVSRDLTADIVSRHAGAKVIRRDLSKTPVPQTSDAWIGASFTPAEDRTADQKHTLTLSDELVDELVAADTVVIGMPMYNFSVPSALKAWIDQVARPGRTFNYTENGPVGLLEGKRVIVAMATGGVPQGSDMDFATNYMTFFLGFLGITDVQFVAADGLNADEAGARAKAKNAINALLAAA
ncbi:MAG: NAD(P)H-dependent oxidoreductase [Pseudomonadota bacterium]